MGVLIFSKLYLAQHVFLFEAIVVLHFSSALHFAISSAVISFISVFFFTQQGSLVCSCFNNFDVLGSNSDGK
jgi:hypothetical protein